MFFTVFFEVEEDIFPTEKWLFLIKSTFYSKNLLISNCFVSNLINHTLNYLYAKFHAAE